MLVFILDMLVIFKISTFKYCFNSLYDRCVNLGIIF